MAVRMEFTAHHTAFESDSVTEIAYFHPEVDVAVDERGVVTVSGPVDEVWEYLSHFEPFAVEV